MKLTHIHVRFFRSFNHDYEARARNTRARPSWDDGDPWYPFVRVPLEGDITAIVGANESGKSQLLTAIKAVLTGSPIERVDFCRYSELYSVKAGELRLPHFGGTFVVEEHDVMAAVPALKGASSFELYRLGGAAPFVVVDDQRTDLQPAELQALESVLPTHFEMETNLAIPDSVSIAELAGEVRVPIHDRRKRASLVTAAAGVAEGTEAATFVQKLLSIIKPSGDPDAIAAEKRRVAEFDLARKLLIDAAGIDKEAFRGLRDAIAAGREGEAEALVGAMNRLIKENLNVQRWWTQDRDFDLLVEAREHELAFTVRDRTGSKYSFGERSQGLRYFLSYFVQLTAHRIKQAKADLLLLDEPDAFLSSTGQQDLLRVLQDYALPEAEGPDSQVVYVTHSPFLIDKNAPHRVRVLDKGVEAEGTRVVRDAANNRYEPLRTSLGAHVAETAFIGGKNLLVEGQADQILLAGLSAHIAKFTGLASEGIDLNEVTIVQCGGADAIPYMAYLARGRDTVKPPCVALLDGDKAGQQAERLLRKSEANGRRVLANEYILRLDLWAASAELKFDAVKVREIEDLLPIPIARRAAINYLSRFADVSAENVGAFSAEAIAAALKSGDGSLWDALSSTYRQAFDGEHLEKAGLAREVVSLVTTNPAVEGADQLRERFTALLEHIARTLDAAAAHEAQARGSDRLERIIQRFEKDYPTGIKKHDARRLIAEVQTTLDGADFPDELRGKANRLTRDFQLDVLAEPRVPNFEAFRQQFLELRLSDRLAYQDDAHSDPAAKFLDPAAPEATPKIGQRPAA